MSLRNCSRIISQGFCNKAFLNPPNTVSGFIIFIDPEFLQSGFGLNFFFLAWRILGKLPVNFSVNCDVEFFLQIFRPCFSGVSAPQKFTRKILSQTCRHSSPISLSQAQHWEPARPLQGSRALRTRNTEKVSKMSPGPLAGTPKKSWGQSKNTLQTLSGDFPDRAWDSLETFFSRSWAGRPGRHSPDTFRRLSRPCLGLFGDFFSRSWAGRPGRHFRDFLGISGPEGPRAPCKGRAGFPTQRLRRSPSTIAIMNCICGWTSG